MNTLPAVVCAYLGDSEPQRLTAATLNLRNVFFLENATKGENDTHLLDGYLAVSSLDCFLRLRGTNASS